MFIRAGARLCPLAVLAGLSACGAVHGALHDRSLDRADELGLLPAAPPVAGSVPSLPPMPIDPAAAGSAGQAKPIDRDSYINFWMAESDRLCRIYKDRLITLSRDGRLSTDILSGTLSGLATIFTAASTAHPLAGAATIATGIGTSFSADMFAQQTGDVLASAIETARESQANVIQNHLQTMTADTYGLYRAIRDVQDYHDMCSLETAFKQIKSSLALTAPDGGATPPAAQGTQTTLQPQGVAAVRSSPLAASPTSKRIEAWLWPGGQLDTPHANALNDWMGSQATDKSLVGESYVELLSPGGGTDEPTAQQMESDRQRAIADLKIP